MDWEDAGEKHKSLWLLLESPVAKRMRRGAAYLLGRDPLYGDMRRYEFAHGVWQSSRIAIVNHLIRVNGYSSYLEIGVRRRESMFDEVTCEWRISVDPDPAAEADFQMTSDDFFATTDDRFDIVFIDGNHTGDQVERDILNSLAHLEPHGVIVLHDMNPPSAFHARRQYKVADTYPSWNGTSWKGFAALRRRRGDLEMCVVDTDWGVGIVRPGRQEVYSGNCETYSDLAADRHNILNLISVSEFLETYSVPFEQSAAEKAADFVGSSKEDGRS